MSIIAAGTTTTTALSSTGNTDGTLQLRVNGTTPSVTLNTLGAIGVGSTPSFGTAGQVLTSNGSTSPAYWSSAGAGSQWTTSGSNIYYNTGLVGIGNTAPTTVLHTTGANGTSATTLATSATYAKLRFQNSSGSSLSAYQGTVNSGDTWYTQIANGSGTTEYNMVFNPFGGNVGIGTATPNAKFTVSNGGVQALELSPTGSTGGGAYIQGYNRSTFVYTPVEIIASSFAVYPQGGASKVNVNFNGLGLGTGTPSSGIGITFPATQSASSDANTLDDYEEGTVTPSVRDYVYDVNCSYTLSSSAGQYTKIGRQVTYSFTMTFATFTAGNGQWFGVDLPFTPSASTCFTGTLDTSGVDWSGSPTTICIRSYVYSGAVYTMFGAMTDNGASSRIYSNGVSAGDTISGTITYFV